MPHHHHHHPMPIHPMREDATLSGMWCDVPSFGRVELIGAPQGPVRVEHVDAEDGWRTLLATAPDWLRAQQLARHLEFDTVARVVWLRRLAAGRQVRAARARA